MNSHSIVISDMEGGGTIKNGFEPQQPISQ